MKWPSWLTPKSRRQPPPPAPPEPSLTACPDCGREMDRVERFMSFLATVGSTAPFVGLFGTVWGIMDSFQSIAASKNTSLAVVAPGIAESLFATALGLVAAIPAVVAYNKLSTDFGRYAARLEAFATEFSAILSRQLDERP